MGVADGGISFETPGMRSPWASVGRNCVLKRKKSPVT